MKIPELLTGAAVAMSLGAASAQTNPEPETSLFIINGTQPIKACSANKHHILFEVSVFGEVITDEANLPKLQSLVDGFMTALEARFITDMAKLDRSEIDNSFKEYQGGVPIHQIDNFTGIANIHSELTATTSAAFYSIAEGGTNGSFASKFGAPAMTRTPSTLCGAIPKQRI